MPIEDYVASLTLLVNDRRFRTHAIFYKRVIGIWLVICMIALLAILFSGLRSMVNFPDHTKSNESFKMCFFRRIFS